MSHLIKRYFLNFWIWWYVVAHKQILYSLIGIWMHGLAYFNVIPMLTNLFRPLFQDNTRMGKIIAFPIRLIWVIVGSILELILTIPLTGIYLIYLALPLIPIWAIIEYVGVTIVY